jgi:hypothetical protein
MENNNPRILAYQLAQTIPDDLLQDISGGGSQMTAKPTFQITGPSKDIDFVTDYHVDW